MKLPWIVKFNQRFARKEIQISQWINFVIASCPGVWNILAWLLSSHLTSFQLSVMLSQDQHHRDEDCQRTKAAIKKLSFETFELNKQSIPGVSVISPAPSPVSQVWYTVNLLHGPEPGTGYYYTTTGSCPPTMVMGGLLLLWSTGYWRTPPSLSTSPNFPLSWILHFFTFEETRDKIKQFYSSARHPLLWRIICTESYR